MKRYESTFTIEHTHNKKNDGKNLSLLLSFTGRCLLQCYRLELERLSLASKSRRRSKQRLPTSFKLF